MKNIFLVVLLGILFIPILSAVPLLGTDVWYIHYLALFSFMILGLLSVLWKFNFLYVLFGGYCLFSTLFIAQQHPRSVLTLIQVVFSLLTIYGISKFTKSQREKILWTVIIAVTIQTCWVLLQYFNLDPIFNMLGKPELDDTVGSIGSHNQIGVFLATTSPVILGLFPYLIPLVIFGLWCSTTTSAWIAFIVASFFLACRKNELFYGLIVLLIIFGSIIFYVNFENLSKTAIKERVDLVKHTISQTVSGNAVMRKGDRGDWKQGDGFFQEKIVTCNPMFGYGLGNFTRISPYTQYTFLHEHRRGGNAHIYSHAHNDYAEGFFELGYIGGVLILLLIGDLFYKFIRSVKTNRLCLYFACILAHMTSALGVFTIHTATSGMILIFFIGLFEGELNEQRK